jgi:hypothetical protein
MDLALHERPGKKWYFFIETDTYVDWENLFFWIAHFDASKPRYMGSPVWPKNKVNFAHGGSGFVLSHTALEKLAEATHAANGTLAASMGIDLAKECCGDEILANILHKLGIKLRGYWPMFNGEKPTTISFGEEQWCEPVITLHHLNPADTKRFYLWQQQYKKISPVSSLFHKHQLACSMYYVLEADRASSSNRYSSNLCMNTFGSRSSDCISTGTTSPKISSSTFVLSLTIQMRGSMARRAGTSLPPPSYVLPPALLMLAVSNGVFVIPTVG